MPNNKEPSSTTSMSSFVRIRQSGLRSVNVERDLQSCPIANGYVLTAQARACLSRIMGGLTSGTYTRAWTLTGPYGSGKSYFGLFLMNLLGKDQPAHQIVLNQLDQADPLLTAQVLQTGFGDSSHGLLPIPVTGFRASVQECLKHGLQQALKNLTSNPITESFLNDIDHWNIDTDSRMILNTLQLINRSVIEAGYHGLLIVFDELGKSLEYSAIHPDQTDIYLLQEIAELANRSSETPLIFICILHQAFERYAALLDNATQREWSKVQGRFEDIAFQEPPSQQMWLLVNALDVKIDELGQIPLQLREYAQQAADNGWCPTIMRREDFIDLAERAYPLHPTVMAALPYLFRRLAQNERSIFAYLASYEPFGFQEFLQQYQLPYLIRLPNLFDYLSANFQARLYAAGRTRAITETLERLSNANGLTALETDLLKTIGLLNWLGEVSPLHATNLILLSALCSPDVTDGELQQGLHSLQTRSMIVYRHFNQTYAIWQGSDVDIEERLQDAQRQLSGAFSLAEEVQHYLPPRPLVARRHSFQKGTLRYFEVQYVDAFIREQLRLQPINGTNGMVLLCLSINQAERDEFLKWAQGDQISQHSELVIGIIERTGRLHELLHELRCLQWVHQNTPELRDDSVARRELQTRMTAIEGLVQNEIERTFSLHRLSDSSSCHWFYRGDKVIVSTGQSISHLLSNICNTLFCSSPKIWNEIINRRLLSTQGAAARRNLLEAMLSHADIEGLGIQGFPPERSMYASLLQASGIHSQNNEGQWIFNDPPIGDKLGLRPAWELLSDFIFKPPAEPRPITELFARLNAPPYGLTDGVLPIFLCAFLLVHSHETTMYREGSLLPEPEIPDWEVLLRRPELFAIAGCRVEGARLHILERFSRSLNTKPATMPVVRALIRSLKSLPEYAWNTQRLTAEALSVRKAIEHAFSPEQLLFHDLPTAFNMPGLDEAGISTYEIEQFFDHLNDSLQALANATPHLRERARDQFLEACELPLGEQGWTEFLRHAEHMVLHTSNVALQPLLKRAAEAPDARAALESILAYIANRPMRTWTDADVDSFESQAQYLGHLFLAEQNGASPEIQLTAEQWKRSQEIVESLRTHLSKYDDDARIVEAALRILVQELHSSSTE